MTIRAVCSANSASPPQPPAEPAWMDEDFVKKFNAGLPHGTRPETLLSLRWAYNKMPSQRVGALYDLIRFVKTSGLDPRKLKVLT